jgi:putative FmdB family regulatory protein
MPTYDYVCDACEHEFELFQPITAEPQRRCPKCKKLKLRRLFGTGAAVMFKGSGFYTTDYRSDSYHKAAKADKGDSSGAGTSDGKEKTSSTEKAVAPEKKKSSDKKTPSAKPKSDD